MDSSTWKCSICSRTFQTKWKGENHVAAHRALPGGVTCLMCGRTYQDWLFLPSIWTTNSRSLSHKRKIANRWKVKFTVVLESRFEGTNIHKDSFQENLEEMITIANWYMCVIKHMYWMKKYLLFVFFNYCY